MIALQRLNGQAFILNVDLIETVEATPDTVIKLVTGKTLIAKNSIEDIVRKTVKFKQLCNQSFNVIQKNKDQEESKAE
ncbi:MAG: flagellar FlbD family protein [Chitinispirillia bacterium]|jgi:flagellar protein FlbD